MSDDPKRRPYVYSGAWWESLSPNELKDGSFPGGKAYDGAVAEIERRAGLKKEKREFRFKMTGLVIAAAGVALAAVKLLDGLVRARTLPRAMCAP